MMRGLGYQDMLQLKFPGQVVRNAGRRAPGDEYTATPSRAQMKPVQIKRHAETMV
jgi:hypothetical protein